MLLTLLLLFYAPGKAWERLQSNDSWQRWIVPMVVYPLLFVAAASVFVQYVHGYITVPEATKEAVLLLLKYGGSMVTARVAMYIIATRYYHWTCDSRQVSNLTALTFSVTLLSVIIENLLPCPFTFVEFIPMYMIWVVYKGKEYMQIPDEDTLNYVIFASALLLGLPFVWGFILDMIVR